MGPTLRIFLQKSYQALTALRWLTAPQLQVSASYPLFLRPTSELQSEWRSEWWSDNSHFLGTNKTHNLKYPHRMLARSRIKDLRLTDFYLYLGRWWKEAWCRRNHSFREPGRFSGRGCLLRRCNGTRLCLGHNRNLFHVSACNLRQLHMRSPAFSGQQVPEHHFGRHTREHLLVEPNIGNSELNLIRNMQN